MRSTNRSAKRPSSMMATRVSSGSMQFAIIFLSALPATDPPRKPGLPSCGSTSSLASVRGITASRDSARSLLASAFSDKRNSLLFSDKHVQQDESPSLFHEKEKIPAAFFIYTPGNLTLKIRTPRLQPFQAPARTPRREDASAEALAPFRSLPPCQAAPPLPSG